LEEVVCFLKLIHQRQGKTEIHHCFDCMCPVAPLSGSLDQPVEPEEPIIPVSIDMAESYHLPLLPEESNHCILFMIGAPIEYGQQIGPLLFYFVVANRPVIPVFLPKLFGKTLIPFY